MIDPVPYEPPISAGVVVVRGAKIIAADLERVALSAIAHEVARRAVHAQCRDDGHADFDRAESLKEAANVIRDVCGLPPFYFGAQSNIDASGK